MKKIKFFAAALGLLTFAACSNSDEVFTGSEDLAQEALQDNAITFGTYMGSAAQTKAASTGSMSNDNLWSEGFGVFAYYTGKSNYAGVYSAEGYFTGVPNFMYNQKVYKTASGDANWTYSPLKYWPNEVATNTDNQPATTDYQNGGNLTFFAYAPYADAAGNGITLSTNSTSGDPKITYVIQTSGKIVDLLWGVYDATDHNVLGSGNSGVESSASTSANPLVTWPIDNTSRNAAAGYAADILAGYKMNADLTKQKTGGKVGFAFKHALAKVGGSDLSASVSGLNGFQVALDIDDKTHASSAVKDNNTVVTISNITIKNNQTQYYGADGLLKDAAWIKGGTFNLATGKWTIDATGTSSDQITHQITTAGDEPTAAAKLATSIAEPASVTSMSGSPYQVNGNVEGVTVAPKNVYATEANPFVFIPGTVPSFEIEVTYIVRTFDSNLDASVSGEGGTWTKVTQKIKKSVTFGAPVQLNKQYNLTMYLGLTSVKFKATVSNWDKGDSVIDTNSDGILDADAVVDLPINVE